MALNVNRWITYAKARLDTAIGDGHRELDRLEAEREVARAEKPWLSPAGDAPTLDEIRARIEWEASKAATPRPDQANPGQVDADIETQRRAVADRLDAIRAELGPSPEDPEPTA